jgi:hypothetical protein
MEGPGSRSVKIITNPDPGGPKTYGTYGSESGTLIFKTKRKTKTFATGRLYMYVHYNEVRRNVQYNAV